MPTRPSDGRFSPTSFSGLADRAAGVLGMAQAALDDVLRPSLRLGITGLARSGKTNFLTSLVANTTRGGRLPFFSSLSHGRVRAAYLEPQPDDALPRFAYEDHLAALSADPPRWPDSTKRISQLRLSLEFAPLTSYRRLMGTSILHVDMVDYPGEWLLDLPLLGKDYAAFSADAMGLASSPARAAIAGEFFGFISSLDAHAPQDEGKALAGAKLFTAYLRAGRDQAHALSALPPGRFLMPGDLEGSPALTFFPLPLDGQEPKPGSLAAMMARRYEAYKTHVVRPFFRDHFARLDRQVVLVDALGALNAGPAAVRDLEAALNDILSCFKPGQNTLASYVLGRRIDRILFAASKADHVPSASHGRLEAIMQRLVRRAMDRAAFSGAKVKAMALASVRATREVTIEEAGQPWPCIAGVPLPGESLDGEVFDGATEVATFPGALPADPDQALRDGVAAGPGPDMRFIQFRPRGLEEGRTGSVPGHIQLDRAVEFLIGDKLL